MSKTSPKNVLEKYFDDSVNQQSPIEIDYVRKVEHDEKSGEYIVFEPFDYADYQKSLGPVANWSLEALLKAGIDPSFAIHTGLNTRLEGISTIENAAAIADDLVAEIENNKTKTE